ncbi:N-acetyltransferase [Caulobacter sp. 17J80-11]|uniref:GNAT family N-acetyltransferase n=1 Tax=Caulobacter sp. 17J80-11 TaxID=2763502 RepID=UPI001653D555|nr:GNAT family N-acetyltransferase [Caulobacter sp. 17J80-11]
MNLRPATPFDLDALARVHAEAGFAPAWPAPELEKLLLGPGAFGLLVELDGAVAGFILCRSVAGEAEILTVATTPSARRKGVGLALVEAAQKLARVTGAEAMFLEVAVDNAPAIELYRKTGFTEAGRRRGYYRRREGAPVDALVLRRELNTG